MVGEAQACTPQAYIKREGPVELHAYRHSGNADTVAAKSQLNGWIQKLHA